MTSDDKSGKWLPIETQIAINKTLGSSIEVQEPIIDNPESQLYIERVMQVFELAEETNLIHNPNFHKQRKTHPYWDWACPWYCNASSDEIFRHLCHIVFFSGFRAKIVEDKKSIIDRHFPSIDIVAEYTQEQIDHICKCPQMIKNRSKISACVHNAKKLRELVNEFGSFQEYVKRFILRIPESFDGIIELGDDLQKRFSYLGNITVSHFVMYFGFPAIKPDLNVMRVLYRTQLIPSDNPQYYLKAQRIAKIIVDKLDVEYNYVDSVLVSIGMQGDLVRGNLDLCRKQKPRCTECKLESICNFYSPS